MKRGNKTQPAWNPAPCHWWGLAIALIVGSLPHLARLPVPLTLIWLAMIGWRVARGLKNQPPPAALVKFAVIALSLVLLVMSYGSLVGREPGTAMLVLMGALKMFELQQRRDAYVVIFLAIFLTAVSGLFHQSLLAMVYALLACWLIIAIWQSIAFPKPATAWRALLASTGKWLLQAIPLMLVLFILFPRIPGPLWRLPGDAHSGMTGLSGQMEPGTISNLAQSDAVAFRVKFLGDAPPPSQRYWRGPSFELTNGKRWWHRDSINNLPINATPPQVIPSGSGVKYSVLLEAHNQRWLFMLDMPGHNQPLGHQQPTLDWQLDYDLHNRIQYEATSWIDYKIKSEDTNTLAYNTSVPYPISHRMKALIGEWQQQANRTEDIVKSALRFFNQEPFFYTLTPPLLGDDPADEFLFETRQGFCEHYASSFTLLMRAAGIPARVVTGYQGGELNAFDDYLIVRQADAHAWAEVWLPEQGWVRVDPTAAVAPERIERSIDLGLQRRGEPVNFVLDETTALLRSWRQAQLAWDAVNHRWNQWVIGYGPDRQQTFLRNLGFPDVSWRGLTIAMTLVFGVFVALLAWWLLRRQTLETDAALRLYQQFCRKLERIGLARRADEGPLDYLARIEQARPDLATRSRRITQLYTAHRYGRGQNQVQLAQLKRAVADFRPRAA